MDNELQIINIDGVDCYEKDGVAYLKLDTIARGLGFTHNVNGAEYVRWERISQYMDEIGFAHKWAKDGYVPENVFYRLAMKAKNDVAEKFQAKVADEIIPSIRKHGMYATEATIDKMIASPEFGIKLLTQLKEERERRKALEEENQLMLPKAEYFDELVDRNTLTSFRDTAKELGIKPKAFTNWLLDNGYIYHDQKDKLMPYSNKNSGLFEVKECFNDKNKWSGVQTMVTPRGRETFRILCRDL